MARKTHLVLHKKVSKSSDMLPPDDTNKSSNLVLSTVWGPTCDGLDKVCDKVLLPVDLKANRDWLVFSNLGCGGYAGGLGLGTAFNGFDPPDVAYCVLGYFASVE
jgi:diaminopimelate decarboxylase